MLETEFLFFQGMKKRIDQRISEGNYDEAAVSMQKCMEYILNSLDGRNNDYQKVCVLFEVQARVMENHPQYPFYWHEWETVIKYCDQQMHLQGKPIDLEQLKSDTVIAHQMFENIQRQIEDIKTIRSEILENATAEIESIDFLQRASDNLRSKEDSNEELIELLLPSLLLLHMEMSSYLREEAEWSQLLNNKTALYVTGRTCDHGEYSVLYAILSTYYEMVLKNHIVFITEGNIK